MQEYFSSNFSTSDLQNNGLNTKTRRALGNRETRGNCEAKNWRDIFDDFVRTRGERDNFCHHDNITLGFCNIFK